MPNGDVTEVGRCVHCDMPIFVDTSDLLAGLKKMMILFSCNCFNTHKSRKDNNLAN